MRNLGTWNKIFAHVKVSNFIILKIHKNIQFRSGKFGALPMGRAAKEQINIERKKELKYPCSSNKTMIQTHTTRGNFQHIDSH